MVAAGGLRDGRILLPGGLLGSRCSPGQRCIAHRCGSEAVVCRWSCAACRGRFGRDEFGLVGAQCRSLALLDAVAALLALQVFVRASEGQPLVAQTRGPFWRWSPLPSQDCTLESALDQNNLHAHFRGHVVIYIRDTCMLMHHSLDNTIIAHAGQHISSIAWAPDPGAHSSGGARSPRGAKTSRSTPITAQVVEDKKARAASTSVPSNSALGDEKGLTGGSKRGKQGGNKTGAAGDVSDGGAS